MPQTLSPHSHSHEGNTFFKLPSRGARSLVGPMPSTHERLWNSGERFPVEFDRGTRRKRIHITAGLGTGRPFVPSEERAREMAGAIRRAGGRARVWRPWPPSLAYALERFPEYAARMCDAQDVPVERLPELLSELERIYRAAELEAIETCSDMVH